MTEKTIVTIAHIRESKLCTKGTRQFFERYGLSWTDFLENGIEAEKLAATGDPLTRKVIECAERER